MAKSKVNPENVKGMDQLLEDNHYPSNIDGKERNDRPFEGTETALPSSMTNPIVGADGKLPMASIKKTK